jgi:hypothetical protein
MCASCGCGILDEDHGDFRSLTLADIEEAAEAANISIEEVAKNIQAAVIEAEESEYGGMRRAS